MSEMVEWVARAIARELRRPIAEGAAIDEFTVVELGGDESVSVYVYDLARAAIKAMREPTPEMCRIGYRKGQLHGAGYDEETRLHQCYRAMIDVALNEPAADARAHEPETRELLPQGR